MTEVAGSLPAEARGAADPFLCLLGSDPSEYPVRFQTSRGRLVSYFRRRHVQDPEMLADEVIFRAYRRIASGADASKGLLPYCFGIAALVLKEHRRATQFSTLPLESEARPRCRQRGELHPFDQHILIEECLSLLSAEDRKLLLAYASPDRRSLPKALGVSASGLRLRVHHARQRVVAAVGPVA